MFDLWWFNQSFNSLREDKETNKDQEKAIYKASQNFSSYISITVISIGFPLCDNTGNLQDCKKVLTTYSYVCSDVGRWKTLGVPVEIGGDNIPTYNRPSPVGIGLTDLPNMGGGQWPPLGHPGSGITYMYYPTYDKVVLCESDSIFHQFYPKIHHFVQKLFRVFGSDPCQSRSNYFALSLSL